MHQILGIHHVTAIASDPQRNVDFYAGLLGLRLVKRTVNFDDPQTYHLYYGDELGRPGSIITFFPWPGARRGRPGAGQVGDFCLSVLPEAIAFWEARLHRHQVDFQSSSRPGAGGEDERILAFRDPDGLHIELVAHSAAEGRAAWSGAPGIEERQAIRGLHSVTIWADAAADTERVLTHTLGFRAIADAPNTRRYAAGDGGPGTLVDIREDSGLAHGVGGAGTVHHVAFAVADDDAELAIRKQVAAAGLEPTTVIDRNYFRSVYFREPGGVLFEIATAPPGFAIDEPAEHLGERLMLPPELEDRRAELEASLPRIQLPDAASFK